MAFAHEHLVRFLIAAAAILGLCLALSSIDATASGYKGGSHAIARIGKAQTVGSHGQCYRRAKRFSAPGRRRRCTALVSRTSEPLYWGATIGSHLTGEQAPWDMGALSAFEAEAGKSASAVQLFQPFAQCDPECSFYDFPTKPMDSIRGHGAIPVLSWSSQSIPSSLNEPDFQLSDLISGRYDSYIAQFAGEARDWGHPFFLRFDWEMNGDWFPWQEGMNGNGSGEFVAAWRHVHDIFTAVGASNVTWVWCPFVDPGGTLQDLSSLYPGDAYVDWTGLDGYNWGTNPASPRGWRSFDQLFSRSYAEISEEVAPSKPMMLGEVGSSEFGGSKSEWIADALARVPAAYPQIRALLWFDKLDDGMDWPIETSPSATAAFAAGVQQNVYVGASYAGLGGGAIPPPS